MASDYSTYDSAMQAAGGREDDTQRAYRKPLHEMSENEVVKTADKWFERVTAERRHVERAALLGTAFLLDQQYVDFAGTHDGARLVQQPAKRGRVRTIEQIIEPAYRGELARLLRNRPQGTVVPDGLDPEDYEAAEAADQVLQHIHRTHLIDAILEEGVEWQIMGGTSLLSVAWDPTVDDAEGVKGDFIFRALSPFEFGVPHTRKSSLEAQPYVMVTKTFELDEIEDTWGVRVKPDAQGTYGSLDQRLQSVISGGTRQGGGQDQEQAVVKETWIKPSTLAPQGAVVITSGGKILDMQVWPQWCKGKYPFAKLEYIPVPGSFWAKPMISSLIPLQRRHNRAASIVVETQNMLSQMGVAVPRNTNVRQMLGGRGMMLELPPGAQQPVTNITAPPVGELPFQELDHTRQAVRDITYQHEVSKGYTPPNVRSGSAISALKEMDDSAATVPLKFIERAVEILGNHELNIVKSEWQEPRLIKVLGEEGELEKRSLVAGGDVGGEYQVVAGSSWPYTQSERQGMVFSLLEAGLVDQREALRALDMGSAKQIRTEREVDYRHARRENQHYEDVGLALGPDGRSIVPDGPIPAPEDWHNHLAHIEIHNRLRKSPKYDKWHPLKKLWFEAHIAGHLAAIQAQMEGAAPGGMVQGNPAAPSRDLSAEEGQEDPAVEQQPTEPEGGGERDEEPAPRPERETE